MPSLAVLWLTLPLTQPVGAEVAVHAKVREMMRAGNGDVVFTELYNGPISEEEREYASRLYEIFFAIPDMLRTEYRATGTLPTLEGIADGFGISREAADLLLEVMTSDSRMPKLLTRDADSGALTSLDLQALDGFVARRGSALELSGWPGRDLPEFDYVTLDGREGNVAELSGQPVLLFVWLTRCPVCRRNTPVMAELHAQYGDRVRFLGLNADEALGLEVTDRERRAWIAENGIGYPNAMLDAATRKALGNPNIFPTFFLVDAEGRVAELALNYQDLDSLSARLKAILTE